MMLLSNGVSVSRRSRKVSRARVDARLGRYDMRVRLSLLLGTMHRRYIRRKWSMAVVASEWRCSDKLSGATRKRKAVGVKLGLQKVER